MARKSRKKNRALAEMLKDEVWELPTSFIDVVFLLLIFFMCVSKFRAREERLDAHLPKTEGMDAGAVEQTQVLEIVIKVSGTSRENPTFKVAEVEMHDPNQLEAHLRRLRQPGDNPVVIDGEQNCLFQHVMSALDACGRAKFVNVKFRAPPADMAAGV